MWCCDRRHFLKLGAGAFLGGCGFAPIYGQDAAATRALGTISVAALGGPMGFEMRQHLTERLGHSDAGAFELTATIRLEQTALAITPQAEITRYNLTGVSRYVLSERATGRRVSGGGVRAFAAYSANDAPFATRSARRDAQSRLAAALADQIATRLLADAGDWLS